MLRGNQTAADAGAKRWLLWLTRPFARLAADELGVTLAMTAAAFLLLCAYYLLKTAREPLILLHGGAEVKSYAAAGQAVLLMVVVKTYSSLAQRVGRLRLLTIVFVFFASNLLVFILLAESRGPIGIAFYLWVGVFNFTAVAQFWGFAADVFSAEQGKRLFAVLGLGSSLGALGGARLASALAELGPRTLMGVGASLLLVCIALFTWVDRHAGTRTPASDSAQQPLLHESATHLLVRDRYLLLIAGLTLVLNWINSNGEYLLDRALLESLHEHAPGMSPAAAIGRFKANYFGWVNAIGMVLQAFVVSRFMQRFGVRVALTVLPVIALGGYGLMAVAPVLAYVRVAKIAENSVDYSIQNTARQALYLVTSRVEKYVGKTAVDTVFVRLGDVLSAIAVWVGAHWALSLSRFALLNVLLVVVWLVILGAIAREHRRRSGEDEQLIEAEPLVAASR